MIRVLENLNLFSVIALIRIHGTKAISKEGDSTDFTHHSLLDDSWREAEPIKTVATLSLFRSFVKSGKMMRVVT